MRLNIQTILLLFVCFFLPFESVKSQNTSAELKHYLEKARQSLKRQPDSTLWYCSLIDSLAKEQDNFWALSKAYTYAGRVQQYKALNEQAFINYYDAMRWSARADTLDYYNNYILTRNLAVLHFDYLNFPKAVTYYDSALYFLKGHIKNHPGIARKYGDEQQLYETEYFKAVSEREAGDINQAQETLLGLLSDRKSPSGIKIDALYQIGFIFSKLNEPDSAMKYFQLGISQADADVMRLGRGKHNIAFLNFQLKDYEQAIKFYREAVEIKREIVDPRSLYISLLDLGESYLMRGDKPQAFTTFRQALNILEKRIIAADPTYYTIYQLMSRSVMQTNSSMAEELLLRYVDCNEEFIRVQQALKEEERRRAFNLNIANYEANIDHQNELSTLDREHTKWILIIIVGMFLLSYFSFRIWRLRKIRMIDREIGKNVRPRPLKSFSPDVKE